MLKGNSGPVTSVSFSRDSAFVSSNLDDTMRVWNVQTGEAVGDPLTGHFGDFITFPSDRYEFASRFNLNDGTVSIRDIRDRTDLVLSMRGECVVDYSDFDEGELRMRWYASRVRSAGTGGWVRDGERLLFWVPWQYRGNIMSENIMTIDPRNNKAVGPHIDYLKVFRYSGTRWTDIYTGS